MSTGSFPHRLGARLTASVRVAVVTLAAAALLFAAATYLPPTSPARAAAGDFSIDFMAAAPQSYDHATGGGAWDNGTIGANDDIVSSLQGGDFTCGDTVTFLIDVGVDNTAQAAADAPQTIEMDLSFTADSTGQSGMAIGDITNVAVNYGVVQDLIEGNHADTGIVDDGGSTATLTNEQLNGTMFTSGATLTGTVVLTDLERNEHVIVRVDTELMCDPGSHPTGNLQASLDAARLTFINGNTAATGAVGGGNQTIPFRQVGQVLAAGIDIEKYVSVDNGVTWDDADTAPGPSAASNVTPQFKFVVTNTGNVDLTNVSVTDTDFDLTSCGFATTLAAGASDDCIITVAWHSGQNFDTATATASDNAGAPFSDTDDANYYGTQSPPPPPQPADLIPSITVTKTANPTSVPETGANVTFTYTVKNSGVEPVTITSLSDDVFGTLAGDSDCKVTTVLAAGDACDFSETHFISGTAGSSHVDVFTAAAVDNDGDPATASDDATVALTSILPLIQVVKTPSATTVNAGAAVTYTYVVTNVGAEPMSNVTVTDDKCSPVAYQSGDTNGDKVLDLDERWTYTCTTTLAVTTTNTVTASGEDNEGNKATDTDQATVTVPVTTTTTTTTTVPPAEVLGEVLARTGSPEAPLAAFAFLLVAGGLGLVGLADLRRRHLGS